MTERTEIHLVYELEDAEISNMDIEDAILTLRGFDGAYGRIAAAVSPSMDHRMTITAVQPGSITFVLEAIAENPEAVGAMLTVAGSAVTVGIITTLFELIRIKLHLRGKEPKVSAVDNRVEFKNADNATMNVTLVAGDLHQNKTVNKHLDDFTKPLEKDGVNAVVCKALPDDGDAIFQRIDAEDRPLFEDIDDAQTEIVGRELVVMFGTLTKKPIKVFVYARQQTGAL